MHLFAFSIEVIMICTSTFSLDEHLLCIPPCLNWARNRNKSFEDDWPFAVLFSHQETCALYVCSMNSSGFWSRLGVNLSISIRQQPNQTLCVTTLTLDPCISRRHTQNPLHVQTLIQEMQETNKGRCNRKLQGRKIKDVSLCTRIQELRENDYTKVEKFSVIVLYLK